jgi:hypothetical protein
VEVVDEAPKKKICRATVYLRQIRYGGNYSSDGLKARWDINVTIFGQAWSNQYLFMPGDRIDSPTGIHEWTKTFPDVLCDEGRVTIDWDTTFKWVKGDNSVFSSKPNEVDSFEFETSHAEIHSQSTYPCPMKRADAGFWHAKHFANLPKDYSADLEIFFDVQVDCVDA